jgi:hypothetical protein
VEVLVTSEKSSLRKRMKEQRGFSAALLVATILLTSLGGVTYVIVQREQWTTIVYETSGVTLELGVDWLYGEFRGMEHPDDIFLVIGISGEIEGGNGGSVRYNFDYRRMNITEYLQLNETEHDALFASSEAAEYGVLGDTFGGSGWGGPINDYTYVWALRFLEVGGKTTGRIHISCQVIIRASPF